MKYQSKVKNIKEKIKKYGSKLYCVKEEEIYLKYYKLYKEGNKKYHKLKD